MVGADGAVLQRRYWTPQADPAHVGKDEAYYIEAYRRVLGEAVACRCAALRRRLGCNSAAATTAPALRRWRERRICRAVA